MTEERTDLQPGLLDRALRVFSDVRAGESTTVLLMTFNLFLALVGYYVIKTVREPLILASGGAEMKSYAAAAQAVVLMGLVPFYSWFTTQVDRSRAIRGVILFFVACIELFYLGAWLKVPLLGFAFFVWVGIFSLAIVAQFWSYANDLYDSGSGSRLFPIIAVGATVGSMAGSKLAQLLFDHGVSARNMMQVTAGLLLVHLVLYAWIERRGAPQTAGAIKKADTGALAGGNGFTLVFKSRYLMLIGLLLILLNLVNTTGEYILGSSVMAAAHEAMPNASEADLEAYIGGFYGQFFFYVNLAAVVLQAFVVSRIVKYGGMTAALLTLPVVALGAYGLVAAGVGFTVLRWAKTAENATEYSLMNTARALLWLPTTREEKYKAKQAIDTFFVRFGDVFSAGLVFAGTTWLHFQTRGFAVTNLVLIALWIGVALLLLREHKRLTRAKEGAATGGE